jgi:hypothetical protein
MKAIAKWITMGFFGLSLIFSGCATDSITEDTYASAPDWAPSYDPSMGARYYYFPDMYTYYDVYSGNFVYWNGFNWSYASQPPFGYSPYDLSHSYIIVLDQGVRDPWMYHNYYSNIYPKGYYYGPHNPNQPRGPYPYHGYNENDHAPIINGDKPVVNPGTPAPSTSTRPRTIPTTPSTGTQPGTITPSQPAPRPGANQPTMQQPGQQPRVQPQPAQPRSNPSPSPQRQQPAPQQQAPRIGSPRPGSNPK